MKAKIRNAMVTWNNPPTREWDDLVAMLNPAYMVGQLRARRERYVALAVCHPVVALPLLRCYQEGLASGTLRGGPVMGGSRPVLPEGGL